MRLRAQSRGHGANYCHTDHEGDRKSSGLNSMSLSIEAVWDDPDMIEVCVTVSNGGFSGRTNVYVAIGGLAAAADQLRGFPSGPGDERRVYWGSEKPESRLGQVDLLFRCRDGAGHPLMIAEVTSSDMSVEEPGQTVRLQLSFEAAGMDRFVETLRVVERAKRGIAMLEEAA